MKFLSKITGLFDRRGGRGEAGQSDLQQNMEKALAMKQEAGPQANIPEHQSRQKGGVPGAQVNRTDTGIGSEPTHTPNLKRSRVARSGDT